MQKSDAKNLNVKAPSLLPLNKSREALNDLDGWQSTDDHKMIYRQFICHDFMAAVDMIDHIAIIAQDEQHHPDIHLTQYRNLRVGLTTHDVGGLSEKDFAVALKINGLPFNKEHQQLQSENRSTRVSAEKKSQPQKNKNASSVVKKKNKTRRVQTKKN